METDDLPRVISESAVSIRTNCFHVVHTLPFVARTLRNVLHFLADVGDICNAKLGSPYRKCRAVFSEAQTDCSNLLGDFNFLCDIVNGFLPLCNLGRGAFTDLRVYTDFRHTIDQG